MLKFTAQQLASLNCKTHDEAAAAIVNLVATNEIQAQAVIDLTGKLTAAEGVVGTFKAELKTANDKIAALEGRPTVSGLTEAQVRDIANTAAASKVTEVAAQMGATPPAPPAAKPPETNSVKALVDAGKFKEAFEADANIRAEFGTVGVYTAYMKNRSRIKVLDKNEK